MRPVGFARQSGPTGWRRNRWTSFQLQLRERPSRASGGSPGGSLGLGPAREEVRERAGGSCVSVVFWPRWGASSLSWRVIRGEPKERQTAGDKTSGRELWASFTLGTPSGQLESGGTIWLRQKICPKSEDLSQASGPRVWARRRTEKRDRQEN